MLCICEAQVHGLRGKNRPLAYMDLKRAVSSFMSNLVSFLSSFQVQNRKQLGVAERARSQTDLDVMSTFATSRLSSLEQATSLQWIKFRGCDTTTSLVRDRWAIRMESGGMIHKGKKGKFFKKE